MGEVDELVFLDIKSGAMSGRPSLSPVMHEDELPAVLCCSLTVGKKICAIDPSTS